MHWSLWLRLGSSVRHLVHAFAGPQVHCNRWSLPKSVLRPMNASACACSPYSDFNALWHFVSMVIFGLDMVISFRVAYIENDILVTEVLDIAKRYLR